MKPTQLEAFKKILPRLDSKRRKVYDWFKLNPGSTRRDVEAHFGDYTTWVPRVTWLEFVGLLEPCGVEGGREKLKAVTDPKKAIELNRQNAYKKALENSPEALFVKSFLACKERGSLPDAVILMVEGHRDFITPKP